MMLSRPSRFFCSNTGLFQLALVQIRNMRGGLEGYLPEKTAHGGRKWPFLGKFRGGGTA